MLAFMAAVGLTFVGAGWYLGWYRVEKAPAAEGHRAVHIDIDSAKISADLKKGGERVQGALDNKINGMSKPESVQDSTPSSPVTPLPNPQD
jgi:hypothetical protein